MDNLSHTILFLLVLIMALTLGRMALTAVVIRVTNWCLDAEKRIAKLEADAENACTQTT